MRSCAALCRIYSISSNWAIENYINDFWKLHIKLVLTFLGCLEEQAEQQLVTLILKLCKISRLCGPKKKCSFILRTPRSTFLEQRWFLLVSRSLKIGQVRLINVDIIAYLKEAK